MKYSVCVFVALGIQHAMRMRTITRVAPKLMTPILLCWPMKSEAGVGDMAVEVEPSRQYSVKFCCCATDDSREAVLQNGI